MKLRFGLVRGFVEALVERLRIFSERTGRGGSDTGREERRTEFSQLVSDNHS